ncbi:hypothetical protein Pla110_09840 [Polystyrenella longa]|uniref:Neutral/alkaline non-lysosomal ceramidase n=1 Tax=Polystyrenella longa TaxID=2528007 RepID=A0A518CJ79_9PLAN|nr:hypothetical protein [Polystyrenella longa]QDU79278.1 hypothetical protein Pla110_09840 [Polystyrenella longa]
MFSRREFLELSAGLGMAPLLNVFELGSAAAEEISDTSNLAISTFRFEVSPPEGHSLCGGWIKPVVGYDDELEAIGVVITGAGKPIVLCAVDWTGLLNSAHITWRNALAEAAGTTPERVAVQCVHQHNAPFACLDAEEIILEQGDLPHIIEKGYYNDCLERGQKAIGEALKQSVPLTHIASGQGMVEKVASNRRFLGADGKIEHWRGSAAAGSDVLRELPEGLVDPWLKTVAFYSNEKKVAAFHYYATHPMSYYGDGRVTSDFAGLARKRRQTDEPGCTHIYFTGCSGNVAAGKYNDGSAKARADLTNRLYAGIVASEAELKPQPISSVGWKTQDILPVPRASFNEAAIMEGINNKENPVVHRNRPSYMVSWLRRCANRIPIVLSSLAVNDIALLHLPAESFLEYQLRAQQLAPGKFVATAAYGDGGPWYIPTAEAYPQGGYEVSVAFCEPTMDPMLMDGIGKLLG